MPIFPLPQFEADLKEQQEADRKAYEALKAPKTMVIRFGSMKLVGEFPYDGTAKPGCGSKIVVRTHRGTEIGEMLTSTCPNSGCSKSVSRKEMLQYIDNSGGRDYPFFTDGRVLRVATMEDMDKQAKLEQSRHELKMNARMHAERIGLPAKIVDSEPLLGGERIMFYYMAEDRIDLRELIDALAAEHKTRIENPLLVEEDGAVYQMRRWYQQFYVDVADVTPDMTDRFEMEVDTTRANEKWQVEVAENLRRQAEQGVEEKASRT